MIRTRFRGSGFTLIELLVVIAIIALLIGILLPALGEARRTAKLTIALAREKQIATATHSYAADYQDRVFSFTWKPGEIYQVMQIDGTIVAETMPDDPLGAPAIQATDIVRRRADRVGAAGVEVPGQGDVGWIPHVLYSHLVLQDYLASRLPEELVVNPEDKTRLNWQIDPVDKFDKGFWLPLQPEPGEENWRWPYSATFETVPAAYDKLQSDLNANPQDRLKQSPSTHSGYQIGETPRGLGDVRISDVSFPSGKVHLMDSHQRNFGDSQPYYGLKQARVPLAFFDSSVSVRATSDSNFAWNPWVPNQPCMVFKYLPDPWEPATVSGETFDICEGAYRWTRGGIKGIDFGGGSLDTGQGDIDDCPYD